MSGKRVTLIGDAMAAVVQGVEEVRTLIGQPHQSLLELGARNGHNVTCGHFALLRLILRISKDREVAASHHGDTPYSGNSVTSAPVTPYTTSVDVNDTRAR